MLSNKGDKEQTFGHSWGRKGGMIWEISIETYTLTYHKTDSQWEFGVWHSEPKAGALWQSRGMGWEGQWFSWRNTCTPMADSCWCMAKSSQYYKVTIFQLKNK